MRILSKRLGLMFLTFLILTVPATQADFLVKDKVIYSPDLNNNSWGFQIKLQGDRLLVSNYATVDGFGRAGSVDYYQLDALGNWVYKQRIEPPINLANEVGLLSFGQTALDGDQLLIGATWADVGREWDAGKVFLFVYDSAKEEWGFQHEFQASDASKVDAFATPAFSEDQVLVGADLKDTVDFDGAGAIYVFSKDNMTGLWAEIQKFESTAQTDSSYLGGHLYSCGNQVFISAINVQNDPNGDGIKRSGVYIYEKQSDGFWFQKRLLLSDGDSSQGGDSFGWGLLCDESRLVISAFQEDTDQTDGTNGQNGAVYFYIKDSLGNWIRQQKIVSPNQIVSNRLGAGMAWKGNVLLISEGVTYGDGGEAVVHQYQYNSVLKTWSIVQTLSSIEPALLGQTINDIAMEGNNVVLAAINDRTFNDRVDTIQTLKWVPENKVDLQLTTVYDKTELIIGDAFSVTYNVSNLGSDTAAQVRVRDMMYGQVSIESAPTYCSVIDNMLSCSLEDIMPDQNFSFSVTYLTDPNYENSFRVKAVVETGMGEANGLNNASFNEIKVSPKPEEISNESASGGGSQSYTALLVLILLLISRRFFTIRKITK